jgi:N,N-dimethylformamidase
VIDEDGSLGFWVGEKGGSIARASTGVPLRQASTATRYLQLNNLTSQGTNTTDWYFVAASYDAAAGRVTLHQEPLATWPVEQTRAVVDRTVAVKSVAVSDAPHADRTDCRCAFQRQD